MPEENGVAGEESIAGEPTPPVEVPSSEETVSGAEAPAADVPVEETPIAPVAEQGTAPATGG